eukprot:TRINITY_DN56717_c0_g1_i1.p2 TRINITY_DN56717_c0_g1~~TRINITY_DN56717_c0_g1_i1.p2  ORF type:complete len:128 (+),score=15.87 TRINITY_DN56717_c0_g1_i1:164-547(+)
MGARWRMVLLLALVVAVTLARNPGGNNKKKRRGSNRSDKEYRNAFSRCERAAPCDSLDAYEIPKCALKCVSTSCYEQVYGEDELEPGELDHMRRKSFKDCFRAQPANVTAQVDLPPPPPSRKHRRRS